MEVNNFLPKNTLIHVTLMWHDGYIDGDGIGQRGNTGAGK